MLYIPQWWGMVVGLYLSAFLSFVVVRYRIDWDAETVHAKRRLSIAEVTNST